MSAVQDQWGRGVCLQTGCLYTCNNKWMSCIEPVLSTDVLCIIHASYAQCSWTNRLPWKFRPQSLTLNAYSTLVTTVNAKMKNKWKWKLHMWCYVVESTGSDAMWFMNSLSRKFKLIQQLLCYNFILCWLSRVKPWKTTRRGRWLPSITSPPHW